MKTTVIRNPGRGAVRAAHLFAVGVLLAVVPSAAGLAQAGGDKPGGLADAGASKPPRLARITSDASQVRCFASNLSPVYEGELSKGAVVKVGEAVGEYQRVLLPLGVVGYVSKRFSSAPKDGLIHTTRAAVSFRYRPLTSKRAEAPVQSLPEGTALSFLGGQGDWWRVRCVTQSAFVPIKHIQVFDQANDTLTKSQAALATVYRKEWRDATASYQHEQKQVETRNKQSEQLDAIRVAFREEKKKVLGGQKMQPILDRVDDVIGDLPEDAPLLASAHRLQNAIKSQLMFKEAADLLNEPDQPVAKIKLVQTPPDKLGDQLVGWLSYRPDDQGVTRFRLEKGGHVLAYLYCNSNRYDLRMFNRVEVGVRGVHKREGSVPYLDVAKLEILGHAK